MASNSHTVPNASVSAGAETGVDTVTGRTEAQGHYRSPVQAKTDVRLRIKHQIYKQDTLQNELEEIIVIPSYTGDSVNTVDIEYGSVIKEATNSDPSPPSMPEKEYKIEDKMMTALKMAFMFFGFPFSIMFAVKPKIGDAAYTIFAILGTIGVLCYLAVILIGLLFRVWQALETPECKEDHRLSDFVSCGFYCGSISDIPVDDYGQCFVNQPLLLECCGFGTHSGCPHIYQTSRTKSFRKHK
eukprot:Gb_04208 [translate_table: standard]